MSGSQVDLTLAERGNNYGDYKGGVRLRTAMMKLILVRYKTIHGHEMDDQDADYIRDIVNKLSRLAATPDHIDSWHDIQGYAKLAETIHKENQDANKERSS